VRRRGQQGAQPTSSGWADHTAGAAPDQPASPALGRRHGAPTFADFHAVAAAAGEDPTGDLSQTALRARWRATQSALTAGHVVRLLEVDGYSARAYGAVAARILLEARTVAIVESLG